eukprot:augustus_masked-scaffold_15-processed-gene-4.13-mRNA-1 protein AED:1.00 eAED:1.00 QI:0/-1/0/0/-1/1/1/0/164
MPGRTRQQIYNKLQVWVNVKAIGDYTNLRLDFEVVSRRNIRWLGEEYKVERKIRSVSELILRKWWTRWKFVGMHEKLSKRECLKIPLVVHDWNNLDHMKARLRMVVKMLKGEKEMCRIYPELNDDLAVELEMLRTRVSDLMKPKRVITEDLEKINRIYELIRMG